ncbi:UDP-N-acetylgalactosamine-undecaprenyl-phosphate N-acetylgalactosaminephosphotransferase [subsurface metagenome]
MKRYPILKRAFDLTSAFFSLLLLLPIMVVVGFIVSIESPGGPLFIQRRVGKGKRIFRMFKFRTMCRNADKMGYSVSGNDDWRLTRIGKYLRDTKLDEFPNLLNVLLGQMSVVGPRPELPQFLPFYKDGYREIFDIRPGLTGPAQLTYFFEYTLLPKDNVEKFYKSKIMKRKLSMDLDYVRNFNLRRDASLITSTVFRLFIHESSQTPTEERTGSRR